MTHGSGTLGDPTRHVAERVETHASAISERDVLHAVLMVNAGGQNAAPLPNHRGREQGAHERIYLLWRGTRGY
eukprot:102758-Pyramimonas_sp.AAC.1